MPAGVQRLRWVPGDGRVEADRAPRRRPGGGRGRCPRRSWARIAGSKPPTPRKAARRTAPRPVQNVAAGPAARWWTWWCSRLRKRDTVPAGGRRCVVGPEEGGQGGIGREGVADAAERVGVDRDVGVDEDEESPARVLDPAVARRRGPGRAVLVTTMTSSAEPAWARAVQARVERGRGDRWPGRSPRAASTAPSISTANAPSDRTIRSGRAKPRPAGPSRWPHRGRSG